MIGQKSVQHKLDDGADDRPLNRANATNHDDKDHKGRPVIQRKAGIGQDAQFLPADQRPDHGRKPGHDDMKHMLDPGNPDAQQS